MESLCSRCEVDLAVLVVYVSLSSRRWLQSKWSINFELISEKIPSIQWNQRIVVATFYTDIFNLLITCAYQQHLQMGYTSLSWNEVRLHEDRLHEFGYPLSILCHKWILICSVCTDCRSCLLFSVPDWIDVIWLLYK
jgi:hypothetical protein